MPFAEYLECAVCKKKYALNNWQEDTCGFRLRVKYDLEKRANTVDKDFYDAYPISHWKYWEFFPVEEYRHRVTIGEGNTNLVKADNIGKQLGLRNLYLKLELSNPSGSFKDRPISVGVSMAKEYGATTVSAASSGNAAASLSSLGAKANMEVVVFVPERASEAKISQLVTLGAKVVKVKSDGSSQGDPSVQLFRAAIEKWGWTPCPSFGPFNPYQYEGTKSMAFEIIEQLEWEIPDWMLFNTGSGGFLSGTAEGFYDWFELGWIEKIPKMVAVQPDACDPIVQAFKDRVAAFEFKDKAGFPNTVAGGLADPHPWDGDSAINYLYKTRGTAVGVSDDEILSAQSTLASKEGIFGSPSGVAAIAGLEILINDGMVDTSDVVVVPISGHGLKDPGVLKNLAKKAIECNNNLDELQEKLNL